MTGIAREPFDAEEAAAARAYAGLPTGEPSRELDARILAQARAAVATPKRRSRPWFFGAGFGAAAAAVMAAGLAWQLGWIERGRDQGTAAPATQRSAPGSWRATAEEEADRIEVEYIEIERKADAADATVAPPQAKPAVAAPPRRNAPPPPPAAPPAPEVAAAAPAIASEPAPQPFPAEAPVADATGGAAPAAPAALERRREAVSARDSELDRISVSGTRLSKRATLPPWTDDGSLAPDAWLERVRERVQAGDRQGAEHSLRRFVLMHPRREVPTELQRLLVE